MIINHAILHVCDFVACENTFAAEELDLSQKANKNFTMKHCRKALNSLDNCRGTFAENSGFAGELQAYFAGMRDFISLSTQVAEFIAGEFQHMEKPVSTDVLVVDFEDDASSQVHEVTEEEIADVSSVADINAYQARGRRYFAVLLLESKSAYMHELYVGESGMGNGVAYNRTVLPAPSQKVASYCLVDLRSGEVQFADKRRVIAGEEVYLIPDKLLQCSMQASTKEVLHAVEEIVEAVAEEYGQNTAVSRAMVKAYAKERVAGDADLADFDLEDMSREIFDDRPDIHERVVQAAAARDIPRNVAVEKKAVDRVAKNHKIRTDTGIEITFPAEYGDNPEYLTFTTEADGTYSISLRNIGFIENR